MKSWYFFLYCPCKFLEVQHQHNYLQDLAGKHRGANQHPKMRLSHSLLKQAHLTIILLGFGRKSCWSLIGRLRVPLPPAPSHRPVAHRAPHADNEHGLWLLERLASILPWCLGQIVAWRQQERSKRTSGSLVLEPAGSFLPQKLYIIWAQEGGMKKMRPSPVGHCLHGDLNSSPTRAMQFSWTWYESLTDCHMRSATVHCLCLCPNAQSLHHCSWELWSGLATFFIRCKVICRTASYKQLHMKAQKQWAVMRLISAPQL